MFTKKEGMVVSNLLFKCRLILLRKPTDSLRILIQFPDFMGLES